MNSLIVLALMVGAGCLIYSIWRDQTFKTSKTTYSGQSWEWKGKIPGPLLQAVKGDRALAKRLLEGAKLKYPGKSDRWYVEKVIYDIERDGAGTSFKRR
jgi:hypothetical protein